MHRKGNWFGTCSSRTRHPYSYLISAIKTGQDYYFCSTEKHVISHQPSIGIMACFNVWLAFAPSYLLPLNGINIIFMPEGRGLLTDPSTWYCNQRTLEVTAETGFQTSFCQKIILIKAINFTSYSSAWTGFPTPKHKVIIWNYPLLISIYACA